VAESEQLEQGPRSPFESVSHPVLSLPQPVARADHDEGDDAGGDGDAAAAAAAAVDGSSALGFEELTIEAIPDATTSVKGTYRRLHWQE
jgi:hypothetical protein